MITVIGLDGSDPSPQALTRLAEADLVIGAPRHLAAVPVPATAERVPADDPAHVLAALDAALDSRRTDTETARRAAKPDSVTPGAAVPLPLRPATRDTATAEATTPGGAAPHAMTAETVTAGTASHRAGTQGGAVPEAVTPEDAGRRVTASGAAAPGTVTPEGAGLHVATTDAATSGAVTPGDAASRAVAAGAPGRAGKRAVEAAAATVRVGLGRAAGRGTANVVVLAAGDPGFFGVVRALRERGHEPEVLPAVSVVARAFARAGIGWDDAVVVSACDFRRAVNVCRAHRKVAVLTVPGVGPAELARALAPSTPRSLVVCENLGGPDERVSWPRLGEATTRPWRNPDVVLVLDRGRRARGNGPDWIAGAAPGPAEWALGAEAFAGGGRETVSAEARALVLARLGPRLGDLVWDVGAGGGEVAVECARFGAAVVAIEKDPAACDRLRRNVVAHGVKVMLSQGTAPAALEPLPDPDAVFVGGGGPEVVAACAARRPRALVAALASAERVPPVLRALREHGYATGGTRLQTAPLDLPGDLLCDGVRQAAPSGHAFLVWGRTGSDV